MKKILSALLCVLTLSIFADNLFENPSFEIQREAQSSRPETWNAWSEKKLGTETYSFEEKIVFSGKRAVRIDHKNNTGMALWMHSNLGAKLKKIPAGTEMELSVMARAVSGNPAARVYLESPKAKRLFIKNERVNPDEWTKISVRFKIEDIDYGAPYVCLAIAGAGSIVYDCAYLGVAGKNPYKLFDGSDNLIRNGSAEEVSAKNNPLSWSVFNRSKNGTAELTTVNVHKGARAFELSCPVKPDGMLSWQYKLYAEAFEGIAPDTDMVLSLFGNTHGNPGTRFRFYIEFMKNGKYIGTYIARDQSIYLGWMEKTLRFKMPKERPTVANIYVQLMTGGKLSFDDVSLKLASAVPIQKVKVIDGNYCRIASGMPRANTFFGAERPSKVKIEYFLDSPELKIELQEIEGKKIKEWNFKNLITKKTASFDFELPELGYGAYELIFKSGSFTDFEWFRIRDKQTRGAYIMPNKILNLDGKPFFPIGIITPNNSLDALRVYSQSGINTVKGSVSPSAQIADYTMTVFKHFDLACVEWNNWGMLSQTDAGKLAKKYTALAENMKKYPKFIGFMSDEAPWNKWKLESMRLYYKMMYKHLPDYLAWMNNAPRLTGAIEDPRSSFAAVRAYSRASDITGLDIYPVPEGTGHNNLPNTTISCVGEYVDLSSKSVWGQKPVWMILQAFGWSEGGGTTPTGKLNSASPRPTKKQLRFMAWNAITHGATGIFWFGVGATDVYSPWWVNVAEVNFELKAITDLMLAAPYYEIKGLPENVRGIEGKGFKVIVNENPKKPVKYEGREIEGQGVLILTDKPLNLPEVKPFVPQKTTVKIDSGIHAVSVKLDANWTAHPEYLQGSYRKLWAKHDVKLDKVPSSAVLRVSVDDIADVYVNGKSIGQANGHKNVAEFKIAKFLKKGENTISFEVTNGTGPTGLVYTLDIDGKLYPSGEDTYFSFDNKTNWKKAHLFGKPPVRPWGLPDTLIEKMKNEK